MTCQPRDVLCQSGDLFLPPRFRMVLETYLIGDDSSLFYVTYWTLIHFMSGIFVAYLKASYLTGFLLHTLWEAYQILITNTPFHTLRGRVDILTDTAAFILGMIAYKMNIGR